VLDDSCGLYKGNTCSEDFISYAMVLAAARNLYPDVAARFGVATLDALEQRYLEAAFASDHGFYGLVVERADWDIRQETKLYNHNLESPVYAAILLMHANNARYTYLVAGNPVPAFYAAENAAALFAWLQPKAISPTELSSDCHDLAGSTVSCADPVANAIPGVLPAGRFVHAVLGAGALLSDRFTFETYDPTYRSGYFNQFRRLFYDTYNPGVPPRRMRRHISHINDQRLPPPAAE
jgi:hypothetical protein